MTDKTEEVLAAVLLAERIHTRFETTHGHRARTLEELATWLVSTEGSRAVAQMNKEDADRWRTMQRYKLASLFKEAHGRPARTDEELYDWANSSEGKRDIAYDTDPAGNIIPD